MPLLSRRFSWHLIYARSTKEPRSTFFFKSILIRKRKWRTEKLEEYHEDRNKTAHSRDRTKKSKIQQTAIKKMYMSVKYLWKMDTAFQLLLWVPVLCTDQQPFPCKSREFHTELAWWRMESGMLLERCG